VANREHQPRRTAGAVSRACGTIGPAGAVINAAALLISACSSSSGRRKPATAN
jgi:hypothetical protein